MTASNVMVENLLKNFKVFPKNEMVGGADFETYINIDGAIQIINRVFAVPSLQSIKEHLIEYVENKEGQNKLMALIIKIKFLKLKTFALPDEEFVLLKTLLFVTAMWCNDSYLNFVDETFYETLEEHYFDNKETMGDGEYLDAMNWLMKHKQLDVAFSKVMNVTKMVIGASIMDKTFHIAIWY